MNDPINAYAAYCDDKSIRKASSSGGMFSIFAASILRNNGVVYGVAMSTDFYQAKIKRVENIDDLFEIRGSKYIQAKVGDAFKNVKQDLESGKNVLFAGTACQINGLKAYLRQKYNNLITIDIICHGVPSYKLWEKFVSGKLMRSVDFRSKNKGWDNYGMMINGKYIPNNKNSYMKIYLQNACLRPACYECFSKEHKLSDITIGDFWGIDKIAPKMNDHLGTSLMIIRSEKGNDLFNEIKNEIKYQEVDYREAIKYNKSEYLSSKKPQYRDVFWQDMQNQDFEFLEKKYLNKRLYQRLYSCFQRKMLHVWKSIGRRTS